MRPASAAPPNRPALPGAAPAADLAAVSVYSGIASAVAGSLVGVALLAMAMPPAAAQDKRDDQLKNVERSLKLDRATRAQLTKRQKELVRVSEQLRKRSVELAKAIQIREADILRLEKELAPLQARERAETALHRARQAELAHILAVLERLRLNPPILLAARPGAPNDAVRGAIILKSVAGRLHRRAIGIEAKLAETRELREQIETRYVRLKKQVAALDNARGEIAKLTARHAEILKSTEAERAAAAKRIAALSAEARSLRDLVGRLNAERRATPRDGRGGGSGGDDSRTAVLTQPSALKRFAVSKGLVSLPAAGRIVEKFGDRDTYGQSAKGIIIAARRGAQVVAPFDGQVVFAGPFRGYGLILIIKHTDGYHSLVAGLSRIDVAAKQWLLAGEPVGIVGEFQASGPRLYLEIRHKGHPINPLPWLAADKRKVNG